jgi:hypothetical protein
MAKIGEIWFFPTKLGEDKRKLLGSGKELAGLGTQNLLGERQVPLILPLYPIFSTLSRGDEIATPDQSY